MALTLLRRLPTACCCALAVITLGVPPKLEGDGSAVLEIGLASPSGGEGDLPSFMT